MALSRAAEDRPTPPEVYNCRVYLIAFLSCFGSWMFGYNNGIISGVLILPSFHRDFNLPAVGTSTYNDIEANIVSMLQVGGCVGAVGSFFAMRRYGRKLALEAAAGVYLVGALLQVCGPW